MALVRGLHQPALMRVVSFYRDGLQLSSMTVEVSLVPGLPVLKILGLPDAATKESGERIKSALRAQGFSWPKARQVLVQLNPAHLKKKSFGFDLAIAAAILWQTNQVRPPALEEVALYGELTLRGEVKVPEDISEIGNVRDLYTGWTDQAQRFVLWRIRELLQLAEPERLERGECDLELRRPEIPQIKVSESMARTLTVAAVGEHPVLFAGPAGSGKSTAARTLHTLLRDPSDQDFLESEAIARRCGLTLSWRPLVSPHHDASSQALVGGGNPPQIGVITRAHGGMLLLDEYLEFGISVQEALREPTEQGAISVARAGEMSQFPARFFLVATTNLCRCGKFTPVDPDQCTCPEKKRRAHLERISGPMLDRFSILQFTPPWRSVDCTVSISEVFDRVRLAQEFAEKSGRPTLNHKLEIDFLERQVPEFVRRQLLPQVITTARRYQSVLRVARTFADLDESEGIAGAHIQAAMELALAPFQQIAAPMDVSRYPVERLTERATVGDK